MKKFKFLVLLLPTTLFAQEKITNVYNIQNGIRDLLPKQIIVESPNKVEIYNTVNGIREITPNLLIQNNEVYQISNGIRSITPIQRFEVQTTNSIPIINNSGGNLFDNPFN